MSGKLTKAQRGLLHRASQLGARVIASFLCRGLMLTPLATKTCRELEQAGLFDRVRIGRTSFWGITPAGRALLTDTQQGAGE